MTHQRVSLHYRPRRRDKEGNIVCVVCASRTQKPTRARKKLCCARSEKVLSVLLVLLLYKHGRDG